MKIVHHSQHVMAPGGRIGKAITVRDTSKEYADVVVFEPPTLLVDVPVRSLHPVPDCNNPVSDQPWS